MFNAMLDQCGINAMVLYNYNYDNIRLRRKDFLKPLVKSFVAGPCEEKASLGVKYKYGAPHIK